MHNCLISIIIPCYNSATFISNTLDMLISQDLSECEVLVINDGSKDETAEIVRKYSILNKTIHLIDKKNEGVSIARNVGITAASGKFIYFLDSDDTLEDGTLDFYRSVLKNNPNNSFFGFGYSSYYHGRFLKDYAALGFDGQQLDSLQLKKLYFAKKLCFHICSCIYEKDFLIKNKIAYTAGLKIGEDVEFLLLVLKCAESCLYHSRHCYIYQIRNDSTMQGYKTFSETNFNSYEIRKKRCFENVYQDESIVNYTNFWLISQFISHLLTYLKSNFKDRTITEKFITDLSLLKLPVARDVDKKLLKIIQIANFIPLRLVLKIFK